MKKAIRRKIFLTCLPFLLVILPLLSFFAVLFSDDSSSNSDSSANSVWVKDWSTGDPYTHDILTHRYGIKADQLDGYLKSTGIHYDSNRINGSLVLQWEKASGLDCRAIIAIAQAESSLGTAGVATKPGANMFGYGAFDSNPDNASKYNDETAVVALTKYTIIENKNQSFKIQDDKAKLNAEGKLTPDMGGVYFTDTDGTGKARAKIMQAVDDWINKHGGTPAPPGDTGSGSVTGGGSGGSGQILTELPKGWTIAKPINTSGYDASSYEYRQCTWFVYNRAHDFGINFSPYMGNGADWQHQAGYIVTTTPTLHSAVSFNAGQSVGGAWTASPQYGHVAFVEAIHPDGSVLISQSGKGFSTVVTYQILTKAQASQYHYVIGQ